MIDLVDRVREHLEGAGFDVRTARFTDERREGVYVRRFPSTVQARYYGGAMCVSYLVQVIARYRSELRAIEACEAAVSELERARVESGNGSYSLNGMASYTLPQEMELDDSMHYAWQAVVEADITIPKR